MSLPTYKVIDKVSQPYLIGFPAIFDLMPLMSFQTAVDADLELRQFIGHSSINLASSGGDTIQSKEHDIHITVGAQNQQGTKVEFDGEPIRQRELWNRVTDLLGAPVEELNTELRVSTIKTPTDINIPCDHIWMTQRKTGTHTRSLIRRFGLHGVRNPYLLMRNDLLERALWRETYSKRLRGMLKTYNLACVSENRLDGWQTFFPKPEGHRFSPLLNACNDSLVSGKWWQDNGSPIRTLGSTNSIEIQAVVYLLRRHQSVVVG